MLGSAKLAVSSAKGTKNQILEALASEWPLTAKQLHNALKRRHSSSASYQAVHKASKELIEEGILQKIDGGLQISYEWAENVSRIGERLKTDLGGQKQGANSDSQKVVEFSSFVEYAKFIINEFYGKSLNPEHKDCMCFWKHTYPIMGVSKEEHDNLKKLFSRERHLNICGSSTFLDKMMSDYLQKLGKNCVLGVNVSTKLDTFINGDYVLQAYFTNEFEQEFDSLYRRVKSEKNFDLKTMFEFTTKPTKIRVVMFKNAGFADQLRKESRELFEEKVRK